uniref:Uncharacterized protein n=1 Tax=Rhizophora mucronata TaxID=61149 RepID=A0A2P2N883_RHIMU
MLLSAPEDSLLVPT